MGDNIKKPDHYCEGRQYEPKDVIRDWGLNFNLGSAVKYISRAGRKGDKLEDLRKANQFLEFEIEELEKANEPELSEELLECLIDSVLNSERHDRCVGYYVGPYRKAIIDRIVDRINNDELDCFDISSDLYHECQEIRDALIIQALRNAGNDTFISKTYAHHVIKGRMTFDSIPDEYKSGVTDQIVEKINNGELAAIDIPTDLFVACRRIREAIVNKDYRKTMQEERMHHVDPYIDSNYEGYFKAMRANKKCKSDDKEHKDDIGMTCKEAAEIGDAIAKGFEDGFKEAEEKHDESDLDIYCRGFDAGYDIAHADLRSVEDTITFTFNFEED